MIDDRRACSSPRLIDDVSRGLATTLFFWGRENKALLRILHHPSPFVYSVDLSLPPLPPDRRSARACWGLPVCTDRSSVLSMTKTPNVTSWFCQYLVRQSGQQAGKGHYNVFLLSPLTLFILYHQRSLAASPPPLGGWTVILHIATEPPADSSSVTEHFVKIYAHNSRTSLFGGSFDPSFRRGPGGFRSREGYTNVTPKPPKRKMYIPNSMWTWSFAIVTFIQTVITLALEWYAGLNIHKRPWRR